MGQVDCALKTFHFFEGGACVRRRGGGRVACAMAQWHNDQSKPGAGSALAIRRSVLCQCSYYNWQ